jgi:hypothetical protein
MKRHTEKTPTSIFESPKALLVRMKTYQLRILLQNLVREGNTREAQLVRTELKRRQA